MDILFIILSIIQFLGIAISGIFGVIGALIEYRDTKGKVTYWGKKALWIGVVSISLALTSHIIQTIMQHREKIRQEFATQRQIESQNKTLVAQKNILETQQRTITMQQKLLSAQQKTLNEIDRTIHTISKPKITFIIKVPIDHPSISEFRKELGSIVNEFYIDILNRTDSRVLKQRYGMGFEPLHDDKRRIITTENLNILRIRIYENCPIFKSVNHPFGSIITHFQFFKTAVKPEQINHRFSDSDMSFHFQSRLSNNSHFLLYNINSDELEICVSSMKPLDEHMWSNGKIVSIQDLQDAQMIVSIEQFDTKVSVNDRSVYRSSVYGRLELNSMIINFLKGRTMKLEKGNFYCYADTGNSSIFQYLFPENMHLQEWKSIFSIH